MQMPKVGTSAGARLGTNQSPMAIPWGPVVFLLAVLLVLSLFKGTQPLAKVMAGLLLFTMVVFLYPRWSYLLPTRG